MATRVRTAAVWVPPLQERDSTHDGVRKLRGEGSILGQKTPDQRPLPGGPRQRHKSPGTEQVPEWLFISQEQPKAKKTWTKSGKLMVVWNGIRKIKASEVCQKAISVLHLENYVFLVQIMFLQNKNFINVSQMERV
uniref:Zinc finger protein 268 n=1 Tax=Balaenoptera musculus TaxID=9771 RepID=A0A8C0DVV5_BALMU